MTTGVASHIVPTIPLSTELVRLGNAKNELDAQTSQYNVWPEKSSNFCQTHMCQIEEGVFEALHKKEVPWGMTDFRAQAIYDMRRSMELTALVGQKDKFIDPIGNDQKYTSGGLTRYIDKYLEYDPQADITNDMFDGWGGDLFDGNSGSESRIAFVGKGLMKKLAGVSTIQKQLEAKSSEVVFGIRFNKVETNYGILYLRHHTLLNDIGYLNGGIVLDINNIEKHVFEAMGTREVDLLGSGQRKTKAYVVEETFCLALRYPDTHAIIRETI
jgi:hypothetical protein